MRITGSKYNISGLDIVHLEMNYFLQSLEAITE